MFSSAEVVRLLAQLHNPSSQQERAQADAYLCAFQESLEAWGVCRELIAPTSQEIPLLFACQVLYVKIKADWHKLDTSQREELKQYVESLLGQALPHSATKKVCQCYALIGMLLMTTSWEQFISHVIQTKPSEVSLEIMDCVPYCFDEFCMAKRSSERIKTLIGEQTQEILSYFDTLITSKGYLWQVLEVVKGWRLLKLEVLSHPGLTRTLLSALSDLTNPNFPSICRVLLDAVGNCKSAYILTGKLKLKPGMTLHDVLMQFPPYEKDSLLALAHVLGQLCSGVLVSADYDVRQAGVELIVGFATSNLAFFLWNDPLSASLWGVVDAVISSSEVEVAYHGLEFWSEFKDLLSSVRYRQHVPDFSNRPWLFDHIVRHTGLIAAKAQYSSYDEFFASIKDTSEVSLASYRNNSEDLFNSFFLLFEKFHPQRGRAYLSVIGQLLEKPVNVAKAEVFMLVMRSLLMALIDSDSHETLREVRLN
jgi:hypothetical protein